MAEIRIGRPTTNLIGDNEAYLTCSCGWRDRTFAHNAKALAARHNEQRHDGTAVVRPDQP